MIARLTDDSVVEGGRVGLGYVCPGMTLDLFAEARAAAKGRSIQFPA